MRSQIRHIHAMSRGGRLLAAVERALACVRRDPRVVVQLFMPDWQGVDAARELAFAAGFGDRICVHHADALGVLGGLGTRGRCAA